MEPFIGQIMMVGFNFAPRGWANCDGQLLPISSNTALFSLLGTMYGGDGRTTFALPDLRSRVPVHVGTGPGLSSVVQGQRGGAEQVTLTESEMPSHSHNLLAAAAAASTIDPTNHSLAAEGTNTVNLYSPTAPTLAMHSNSVSNTGGNQAFGIRQPFLGIRFIIALQGVFPSRN